MESVWLTPEFSAAIISGDIQGNIENIAKDILCGKLEMLVMLENMSGVLTNKEPENREKGMAVFSSLLELLPKDFLNEKQIKFISSFYVDRLKDNHRIIPAVLDGFLALIEMKAFDSSCIGDFFRVLFQEVPCQSQTRIDRLKIYKIIQRLLTTQLELMKTLGPDFVYGVITSIDGERDPRNLLFLFTHLPEFIRNIPLYHLTEEMFDIISCYYPIDFNPSQNDPEAVTRQKLSDHLAPCLCAIPEFAEFCLPLLIEKLDSALRTAKIDSLNLLAECCKTFKTASLTPFLKTLWSSIQREIFHKTDEELKMAAHRALYALIEKLSQSQNTDQSFENFLKGILISIQTIMADANTTQAFDACCQVLLTSANASKRSCVIITSKIIPSIIAYYNLKFSEKLQLLAVNNVTKFFEITQKHDAVEELRNELQEIPQLCLETISIPKKEYQLQGFSSLVKVVDVLPPDILVPFLDVLCYNIHNYKDENVINVCIRCIKTLGAKFPEEVLNLVIKNKMNFHNIDEDLGLLDRRLRVLINMLSLNQFSDMIMKCIVELISKDSTSYLTVEVLSDTLADNDEYSDELIEKLEAKYSLTSILLDWLKRNLNDETKDIETYDKSSALIAHIVKRLSSDKQMKIVKEHYPNILKAVAFNNRNMLLIKSIGVALRPDVIDKDVMTIANLSSELALKCQNDYFREQNCILIAHILNKLPINNVFDSTYSIIRNSLDNYLEATIDEGLRNALQLYAWLAKSLVSRGYDDFQTWMQKIIDHLCQSSTCDNATESIRLITTYSKSDLDPSYHCNVTLFHKQRIFNTFFELCKGRENELQSNKEAYLLSVAYIVSSVPKTIVKNEAEKLIPLVIDSLAAVNATLLAAMLDVLSFLTDQKNSRVVESVQTIMPRLIKLASFEKSMKVRITSLDCLYNIANNYPTTLLLPYKDDIVFDLRPVLDDNKRLVRYAAVRARCRWIMVGSPGEE